MKVLVTIAHFFSRESKSDRVFGSLTEDAATRAAALGRCIDGLARQGESDYSYYQYLGGQRFKRVAVKQAFAPAVDIAICTHGTQHVLDLLYEKRHRFHQVHVQTDDPMYIGAGCHNYLLRYRDEYDYFCFLEDDLIIHDPLWFAKYEWFNGIADEEALLQPHRFERKRAEAGERKCLVDPVFSYARVEAGIGRLFYRYEETDAIAADFIGQPVSFERASNPHSGCFFVNRDQLARMAAGGYFGKRCKHFVGPLESSASLSIMSTFRVYKPSFDHIGFLEIEHAGERIASEYDSKSATPP